MPRYQFQVGQEFVYSYRDDYVEESRRHREGPVQKTHGQGTTEWHVWVLGKNADGSVRLLIDRAVREVALDKHAEVSWRLLTDFDIFPDGRIVAKRTAAENGAAGDPNYPTPLFVTLPADKNALAGQWPSPTNVGSCAPAWAARTAGKPDVFLLDRSATKRARRITGDSLPAATAGRRISGHDQDSRLLL